MNRWSILTSILVSVWYGYGFSQPANIYTFSPDMDLGVDYTAFSSSGQHYIGARGETVYVVTSNGTVWCQKSTDGGKNFASPVYVGGGYNPSMRVDTAGGVYVAYQDRYADIRFSKSTNGGMSFTPGVKVNDDTIPQIGQEKPAMAVNNKGQIFIAWNDQRDSPPRQHRTIFSSASYDGGQTFSPNVLVNDTSDGGGVNDIASDDEGRVYALYKGRIIAHSSDSGQSFPYRTYISEPPFLLGFESMAITGPLVGLFGEAGRIVGDSLEITLRFVVSTDYGETFHPSVRVDDDTTGDYRLSVLQASIGIREDAFFLSWSDDVLASPNSNRRDIFFSYTSDTGRTFAASKKVHSDSTWNHYSPSIAVNNSSTVFVAWTDPRRDPLYGENWHSFVVTGSPTCKKGDLNLDLILSMADVVTLLNAVFLQLPFPAPFSIADGNCDAILTPSDIVLELNAVFLQQNFPC